jgi:hypothetical protein
VADGQPTQIRALLGLMENPLIMDWLTDVQVAASGGCTGACRSEPAAFARDAHPSLRRTDAEKLSSAASVANSLTDIAAPAASAWRGRREQSDDKGCDRAKEASLDAPQRLAPCGAGSRGGQDA